MVSLTDRTLPFVAFLIAATTSFGCYVGVGAEVPAEVPPPAYADGYGPMYYDAYVVYYDDVGRPFYYANGTVVWIAPAVAVYPTLVTHWHHYGPAYHRWYVDYGYRYRGYRGHHR